jgi:hypothetical protein
MFTDENYTNAIKRETLIAFAKFAKNYRSSRNIEKAYEQWLVSKKNVNYEI